MYENNTLTYPDAFKNTPHKFTFVGFNCEMIWAGKKDNWFEKKVNEFLISYINIKITKWEDDK